MSEKKWKAERRLLAGQQLFFCIGILINAILIFSPRLAGHPTTTRQQHKTDAITTTTSPPVQFNIIPSPKQDSEDWVTIIIVCGNGETDTVREMKTLLTSAILLSSAPLHFVFVTEQESSNRIKTMFETDLQVSKKPIKVDTWLLSVESIKSFASVLDYNPSYHHSGVWGTSKLMLPWIVKDLDKAVQVDTDMIFLDDPARVWHEFDGGNGNADDSDANKWLYKMPLPDPNAPFSICSCIVLLKLGEIRQSNTFPTLMEEALASHSDWKGEESKLYDTPNGDQGLYWAMLRQKDSHIISALPNQWNADRCNNYFGVLQSNSRAAASMLHNNCDNSNSYGMANIFFKFYDKYRWHWLRGEAKESSRNYKVDVTVHPEETERLQNLFKCLREKRDFTLC
mmetsp:Transcript_12998/g.30776  ORF Transcript_12998/g.30776 Transcript_12998/m.30776 type:complete len:397 (-) Transcript_12998:81-1271(-)|eukprot:CAMPEP_0113626346 /NCGR_PEP_ID=MMETSP0017_2-20120614/13624_1 /TAXON_ID=2856 /ORGANISM="Cylindrotheca closterium" /LENGTH=396 /DNA_ID=CAMNT_0000536521 /DNA_START=27 /DNA_END=1217 /DNA_ORIENTATION=+ /assembly_acc=CAM_ASM_000147